MSMYRLGIPRATYINEIRALTWKEGTHGLAKSFVFAGIISIISCYKGFTCEGGAEGVGKATTSAVVISMVLVMVCDYFFIGPARGLRDRLMGIRMVDVHRAFGPNPTCSAGAPWTSRMGETLSIIGGSGTRQKRHAEINGRLIKIGQRRNLRG